MAKRLLGLMSTCWRAALFYRLESSTTIYWSIRELPVALFQTGVKFKASICKKLFKRIKVNKIK